MKRIVGSYGDTKASRQVIVTAGMHGNEQGGVQALHAVFSHLNEHKPDIGGCFTGVLGNIAALKKNTRCIDIDLNRLWTDEQIEQVRRGNIGSRVEDKEQAELLEILGPFIFDNKKRITHIDLHSSSAETIPFAVAEDPQSRHFSLQLPLVTVGGWDTWIANTLFHSVSRRGHISLNVEAGQHDKPETAEHHQAVLWCALVNSGLLNESDVPEYQHRKSRLKNQAPHLPHALEVCYSHWITPADQFCMFPKIPNFKRVQNGELLAHDKDGEILASEDSFVVLPTYVFPSDYGFFLAKRAAWR